MLFEGAKMCELFLTLGQIQKQQMEIAIYEAQQEKENEQEAEL